MIGLLDPAAANLVFELKDLSLPDCVATRTLIWHPSCGSSRCSAETQEGASVYCVIIIFVFRFESGQDDSLRTSPCGMTPPPVPSPPVSPFLVSLGSADVLLPVRQIWVYPSVLAQWVGFRGDLLLMLAINARSEEGKGGANLGHSLSFFYPALWAFFSLVSHAPSSTLLAASPQLPVSAHGIAPSPWSRSADG